MTAAMQNQLILIVEDNNEDFETKKRALRQAGLRNNPRRCEDGDEALAYLHRSGKYTDPRTSPRSDIILLDLNLPGTDGREVLREIKTDERLRTIPVIVLTTSEDQRDIQYCYNSGANSYLHKQVDLTGFYAAIQRLKDYWFEIVILPREEESTP